MISLLSPTLRQMMDAMLDLSKPGYPVEVKFNEDRTILWVNVGPVCVLRICGINDGKIVLGGTGKNKSRVRAYPS